MDSMDTTQNYILSTANLRQALITHVVSTIRNICQIESLDVSLKRTTKKILTRYSSTRTCQEVRARVGEKLRSANRKITPVVLFTTACIYYIFLISFQCPKQFVIGKSHHMHSMTAGLKAKDSFMQQGLQNLTGKLILRWRENVF